MYLSIKSKSVRITCSCFVFSESCSEKVETAPQSNTEEGSAASSSLPDKAPSDGERMTSELRDIISQFMQTVSVKMSHYYTT